jgi:phosphocarrier protein
MGTDGDPPAAGRAQGTFPIKNLLGLHARAAAQLVNVANRYQAEVVVRKGRDAANGKSNMGVLMLAAARGSVVEVEATGTDAAEAVAQIGALIDNLFGEEQ